MLSYRRKDAILRLRCRFWVLVFQELYFYDAELVLGLAAVLGLEEVELAGGGLSHFHDAAEGVFVFSGTLQADGDLIGGHALGGREMDVAEAALCLAAPDELVAGIDLQGVAAQTPACELEADVVDDGLLRQLIGNPGGGEAAIVLPLREFVVVEAADGMLAVVACCGREDRDAAGEVCVRGGEGCFGAEE